jgi:hypothetical protein
MKEFLTNHRNLIDELTISSLKILRALMEWPL